MTDLQELVIGTLPTRKDTDGDGYSDLEERARGADPRNAYSVPDVASFGLGSCGSQENGFITMLSAVYLSGRSFDTVRLEIGLVYQGRVLKVVPQRWAHSRGFLFAGRDPGDTLAVIEIGLPEDLLNRMGQMNMFAILSSTIPDGSEPIVTLLPIVDFSGVAMSVELSTAAVSNNGGGASGVLYRPLAGDDQIPSTWNGGEICFQRTSAVGMSGASVVHEVDGAECLPMDTYCSPGDCGAGVGKPLELPDPAALAGG